MPDDEAPTPGGQVTDIQARLIAIGVAGLVAGVVTGAVSRRSGEADEGALPPARPSR